MVWTRNNQDDSSYPVKYASFVLLAALCVFTALPSAAQAADPLLKEVVVSSSTLAKTQNKSLVLTQGKQTWTVPFSTAKLWYKTRKGDNGALILQLRPGAIYDYLNTAVSPKVNNTGTPSRFVKKGDSVVLVSGGTKGQIVDGVKTSLAIRDALVAGKITATVSLKEYRPELFSAADFAKLKFPDQLAKGETNFAGSPKNRVHNIQVATERFNGLVLQAGEEFSFNKYLGTVDGENGYLPELVIKENVTTPEFGGGICQVSTTAFRAAMYAGLKVTSRRNHSYPVKYYGTPGFDATVYQPAPDFRFVNDTGHAALLTTSITGTKLTFTLWGTSDGRKVKINGPFVTDKKPDGSLTAAVAQIVTKNGKTIREDNFVSKYQSPDKFPKVLQANGEKP